MQVDPQDIATRLQKAAASAKESFALAFLQQTGLLPDQATMMYGVGKTAAGEHVFKVWFERKLEQDEREKLQQEIITLKSENQLLAAALERPCTCVDKDTKRVIGSVAP